MGTLKLLLVVATLIQKASLELRVISDKPTLFGDSPHWCPLTQSLYYVDFFGVKFNIYRYDYSKNKIYAALIANAPSPNAAFIIPIEGRRNEFAIGFSDRKVKRVFWDGKSPTAHIRGVLFEVEQNSYHKGNIWHIGKADPFGRFYGGTMRTQLCTRSLPPDGSVYLYTNGRVTKQLEYVELSNGIAHSLREKKVFHIDGCDFVLKAYDWDIFTGKISNGRKLYEVFDGSGVPTRTGLGVTIDTDDNLYIARYNGSSIVKVDSRTGKQLKVFEIPTAFTLNIAFGGPDLNELFVVTGQLPFDLFTATLEQQQLTPTAGFLYIIKNVDATGHPGWKFRIN